ncbi:unnamed protein product [Linum trigynum]|uniref:Uncharacterized protein n=1 Tax=Linum trigynum TaxID=586398 RepID=A0AAV2EPV9_9ROSI
MLRNRAREIPIRDGEQRARSRSEGKRIAVMGQSAKERDWRVERDLRAVKERETSSEQLERWRETTWQNGEGWAQGSWKWKEMGWSWEEGR